MEQRDDLTGALLAALLVRHLVWDEDQEDVGILASLNCTGEFGGIAQQAFPDVAGDGSVVGPFDAILAELTRRIQSGEASSTGHET